MSCFFLFRKACCAARQDSKRHSLPGWLLLCVRVCQCVCARVRVLFSLSRSLSLNQGVCFLTIPTLPQPWLRYSTVIHASEGQLHAHPGLSSQRALISASSSWS